MGAETRVRWGPLASSVCQLGSCAGDRCPCDFVQSAHADFRLARCYYWAYAKSLLPFARLGNTDGNRTAR